MEEKQSEAAAEEARRADEFNHQKTEPSVFVGKHRLAASITHLQNQINIIKEELEMLETIGESSIVCREIASSIESSPDPLLPMTRGPADAGWDRWWSGDDTSRRNKRWI